MKNYLHLCKGLYYLVTIADNGSLTKAAEKLYIAQPSLTHYLQEMEAKLGFKIFTRVKTGLVPTEAGATLIQTAKTLLAKLESTIDFIHDTNDAEPYCFATPAFRGTLILPSLLLDIRKEKANINFQFLEILTGNIPAAFNEQRIHAALMVNSKMPGRAFKNRKITDEEVFLIAASDHPMYMQANRDGDRLWIDMEKLNHYNIILLKDCHQLRLFSDNFFSTNNIHPKSIITTSDITTSMRMAESGIGATFMPAMFLSQCACHPVSVGKNGLKWPIYLCSSAESNEDINQLLYDSIKKTIEHK